MLVEAKVPSELELRVVRSCLTWVLGTKVCPLEEQEALIGFIFLRQCLNMYPWLAWSAGIKKDGTITSSYQKHS